MSNDARTIALQVVEQVLDKGRSLDVALQKVDRLPDSERANCRATCFGILRWQPQLDGLLQKLMQRPLKEKDRDIHRLLQLGLYQLLHSNMPAHAAINTTVDLCKKTRKSWASGLVNGVLRNAQRQHEALLKTLPPAVRLAHPDWLWQQFVHDWPEHAERIAEANNGRGPMVLRVNQRHVSRTEYLARLQAAGIEATPCLYAEQGIRLQQPVAVEQLPGWHDGDVSVQDEAAQVATQLLAPQAGDRVLDACAAPGGKTAHIAESQPELASLVAVDIDEERLQRVRETLSRLKLDADCIAADAGQLDNDLPFQRILLDAPCSGTGVIRRHPDIKQLRQPEDIPALVERQRELLEQCWQRLAPGGRLVYATCSILRPENGEQIAGFLQRHADAQLQPVNLPDGVDREFGCQLFPLQDGHDGFFYAVLDKASADALQ